MTWADDYYAGTYNVNRSNLGSADHIYYNKKFLRLVKQHLRMIPLGQPKPLPKGRGAIVQFERYLNLALSLSATHLAEGVNPNATQFKTQKLQATIKEWGAFGQITSFLADTFIDKGVDGAVDVFAEHGARALDLMAHSEVACNGSYGLRADLDATYRFSGVVDDATTLKIADTALSLNTNYGDADDDLNQSICVITSGTGYGQARVPTDYDLTGDALGDGTMIFTNAFDVAPVAGDTYVVTSFDDTIETAGDKLTYEACKRAVALLRSNRAMTGDANYYVGVADPFIMEDIMDDTKWKDVQTYKDQTTGIFRGEVGKFCGIRFIEETNAFRFPVGPISSPAATDGPGYFDPTRGTAASYSNYSATGTLALVPILGREAFGVTNFSTDGARSEPIVHVKTPGPNSTDQPLNRFKTVGWLIAAVQKALNPLFCVSIGVRSNV